MNKQVLFILGGIVAILWIAFLYQTFADRLFKTEDPVVKTRTIKNGPIKTYRDNGKLKTLVNYKNGKKDGTSYLYHRDGETVQLEMPYVKGKRQGTSKKYFSDGDLYAATPYEDNKLHGVRKVYYHNGHLKASIPYQYGFPGTGLEEYLTNGSQKELPEIVYRQEGNIIRLSLSKSCEEIEYHIGKLIDGQFFDALSTDLQMLPDRGTTSYVDLSVFTPSYLKYQDIVCVCKSSQGHTVVLKKHIDGSSLKNVN